MKPFLSICVPSRNRQVYFQSLIKALTASSRDDVEFVFSDNSDEPDIMNAFMQQYADDKRVVFLPSEDSTLPMMDNWERTIRATRGEWISFIGDDDYIDPDLVIPLRKLLQVCPDLEAFDWDKLYYSWPDVPSLRMNDYIPLGRGFYDVPQDILYRRAICWEAAVVIPIAGFSIYHGAIRRTLADRICERFGGRYFEHPTPDFDFSFKTVILGRKFIWSERPFSIHGCCAASNMATIYSVDKLKGASERFEAEMGRDINADNYLADFPFHNRLGVPVVILQVNYWLKWKYGIFETGWEKTFAECCATFCEIYTDRDAFDEITDGYRQAFARWLNGSTLKYFNPVFRKNLEQNSRIGFGLSGNKVLYDRQTFQTESAFQHYRFAESIFGVAYELECEPESFMDKAVTIQDLKSPIR